MDKVAIVGASGTIGSRIVNELEGDYELFEVGHSNGEYRVDLADPSSVKALFGDLGPVDHVISAAGVAEFGSLDELDDGAFETSLENKLMGQVNLVRYGREHLEGGSFTLTSGILAEKPTAGSAAISMVNGGLHGFARAAALDLEGEARVNVVSPGWISETLADMGRDPSDGISAAEVAERGYRRCLEGDFTGRVIEVANR